MLRVTYSIVLIMGTGWAACVADESLTLGANAPTSHVAHFVTGNLAPRGTSCPVLLHREATKIALYVKTLDASMLPLVRAIEKTVASDSTLQWSFVFVSHENSPTPTQEQWDEQLEELKSLAEQEGIKNLSLGVMIRIPDSDKPVRAKRQLGFFGEADVVVMLICPNKEKKPGVIRYVRSFKAESIDGPVIDETTQQLKQAIEEGKR